MTRAKWLKHGLVLLVIIAALLIGGAFAVRHVFNRAFEPLSTSQKTVLVTVPSGASVQDIAKLLKDQQLIRATWAFETYVRNKDLASSLQAGTYALSPSMGVAEIANIIAHGEISSDLITILPGQRIDQIEAMFINNGFKPTEVKKALNASHYKNHPALVDKPRSANLEGYLYPESFHKTSHTKPEDIVRASLDEMHERLTPAVRRGIAKRGLSVYEGIILASIIEREVSNVEDRPVVAQVFLTRLKKGMKLESDATAPYGAIKAGEPPSGTYDSKYNTYLYEGLTPTPISNASGSALKAVANPARTDYIYFVSGDDGKTYFSKTLQEHEANVNRHCKKLCGN